MKTAVLVTHQNLLILEANRTSKVMPKITASLGKPHGFFAATSPKIKKGLKSSH